MTRHRDRRFIENPDGSLEKDADGDVIGSTRWYVKEAARKLLERETERRRYELISRLNFSYANLTASTNHIPSRESFKKLAIERGMSEIEFERWANTKGWTR